MPLFEGGLATYGKDIGIVMLDCRFARPPGDIGNAASFPFPVRYAVVENTPASQLTDEGIPEAVQRFFRAAKSLQQQGARAILTSCGLLLPYQDELRKLLDVPVASSPILLLPLIRSLIGPDKQVGLVVSAVTDNIKNILSRQEYAGARLISMEGSPEFMRAIMSFSPPYTLDSDRLERELLDICGKAMEETPDIGAFLFECTNLPPYSSALRRKFGLPVFDVIGLCKLLHAAAV